MDDLTELLKRIHEYGYSYKASGCKMPLFRLTPIEYRMFLQHLSETVMNFKYDTYGLLPTYAGVDFELVGKPVLFNGKHIRSDSGIELNTVEL